jgi:hypothetical protein
MKTFMINPKIFEKYLALSKIEPSRLKIITCTAFLVAMFIAIVPGIEGFVHGFLDGIAEHR